jgi:anti-sigma regulatory factor (Ser/Thr protein kinase)
MHNYVSVLMEDPSQVGEARRAAMAVAAQAHLSDVDAGKLSIIVNELSTNMLKHAKDGEILIGNVRGEKTVDVIALDHGPGIPDLAHAMRDGFSSAGTAGQGLGAVKRQSEAFDIYSRPGFGTVVIASVGSNLANHSRFDVGVVCRPVKGEIDCGDGWAVAEDSHKEQIMLVDGLGHGPDAYAAAAQAMQAFRRHAKDGPTDFINMAHLAMRATRGAALAVADVNLDSGIVRYAGVGNIAGAILENGLARSMVSHNGIVGGEMRKVQEFTYPWQPDSLLVMNSDGINTHWKLEPYPGLENRSALMIAAVLYRDFKRTRDDATVLVARQRRAA